MGRPALRLRFPELPAEDVAHAVVEEAEDDRLDGLRGSGELARGSDRDAGHPVYRKAEDPGRDRRQRHGARPDLLGARERRPHRGGERLFLSRASAPPDRPHRVDDPSRRELAAAGHDRFPRRAPPDAVALLLDRGPAPPPDRARYPASELQSFVGRIHDRVDLGQGDVLRPDVDPRGQARLRGDSRRYAPSFFDTASATDRKASVTAERGSAAEMGTPRSPPMATFGSIGIAPRNGTFTSCAVRSPPPCLKISSRLPHFGQT